jgi:precorrin-8X/cobalt-precorrin-8 methylmutase
VRRVHPIEAESYAILRSRVDTSRLPRLTRAVVERVIHASADPAYLDDLVTDEAALRRGWDALRAGAPLVVDAEMVGAGITTYPSVCRVRTARPVDGRTRSAQAFRDAYAEVGPGAVWVVGNAPTALAELLAMDAEPALVVGLPVGFVGAVEAKEALRRASLPAVSNRSEKGGSAVAAAAVNALLYEEEPI